MATTAICAQILLLWGWPTWLAFFRTPLSGHTARARYRQNVGRVADDHQSACSGTPSTGRSQSKTLRSACPSVPGVRLNGEKARQNFFPPALLGCVFVPLAVTISVASVDRKNGC